ncbi:MAG: transcriptional repressor [Peptococcaceae bacterium]|nr:transcriptional repressor [Peptococcaceae bacterium]
MQNPRSTKQRRAIMEVFDRQKSHLAAEEVYQLVRNQLPKISLGTVYRNLEALSQQGDLQKTMFPDGKARYEGTKDEHHHHIVCIGCSNIMDISICPLKPEVKELLNTEDFEAVYHRFEVYGYCKDCREKEKALKEKG